MYARAMYCLVAFVEPNQTYRMEIFSESGIYIYIYIYIYIIFINTLNKTEKLCRKNPGSSC